MSWKNLLHDYLTFSRKDRIGILGLLCLIMLMILIPFFYGQPDGTPSQLKADSILLKATSPSPGDKFEQRSTYRNHLAVKNNTIEQSQEIDYYKPLPPFPFDPNTLDEQGWSNLGLPDRTIKTIMNYRSKGGRFYKKEDLQKIWGLSAEFYQHVASFIQIAQTKSPAINAYHQKKERTLATIDINNADTTAFIALPGIGSKLASRIINFRDKLGGFCSINQVGEVYGLPDSTYQQIKHYLECPQIPLHQLNINTATKDELKTHPYIRWNLANAIVEFRNQHGNFTSLDDLKKIILIDELTFKKILPYLSL